MATETLFLMTPHGQATVHVWDRYDDRSGQDEVSARATVAHSGACWEGYALVKSGYYPNKLSRPAMRAQAIRGALDAMRARNPVQKLFTLGVAENPIPTAAKAVVAIGLAAIASVGAYLVVKATEKPAALPTNVDPPIFSLPQGPEILTASGPYAVTPEVSTA